MNLQNKQDQHRFALLVATFISLFVFYFFAKSWYAFFQERVAARNNNNTVNTSSPQNIEK